MKNTKLAFNWIIDILESRGIVYRISGGFAAGIYGVKRELADIDIEVTDADISKIVDQVKSYIIFGPARYRDNNWDLQLMTLKYQGQEIDIGGNQVKLFNQQTQEWEESIGNLHDVELKEVFGRQVPLETKESLIAYKTKLAREVDLEDVRQLEKSE